ncbi:MAG: sensor histidine kinase [Limnochordales bacterium]|nr:sensor histidine kinase [Limnochordales bacterium]
MRRYIWAFLRDRAVYIAAYAAFGTVTVAVVQLDLWLSSASLQLSNVLYLYLLGLVGLVVVLAVDYQRQAAFWRWSEERSRLCTGEPPRSLSLDELALLPEPRTLEQENFSQAWSALYGRLRSELAREQERGRRNIRFLSQWAHHMKTPLAVIALEIQKGRKHPLPPELEAILSSIEEETERLNHSLQMLLNVVRLEDFTADFRVEPVDLVELLRRLINDHKRSFINHRVYPKLELAEESQQALAGTWLVRSDAKWLRFVLEQLLSNAIKYSSRPERDGQVIFRLSRAGEDTVLEIADNGIGIPPEDLDRVFEPFYTGTNGRAFPQSTGLGLYLAWEVCNRLGHGLRLESRRGEGTRVFLHFPHDYAIFSGLETETVIS